MDSLEKIKCHELPGAQIALLCIRSWEKMGTPQVMVFLFVVDLGLDVS